MIRTHQRLLNQHGWKLAAAIFCLSQAINAYGMSEDENQVSDKPSSSGKNASVSKNPGKKDETIKQKEKPRKFVPSRKISPDVPVSFPADI